MSPSPKSSIYSNEYFQNLTKLEEKELANMFSGMIGKVEVFLIINLNILHNLIN